MEIEKFQQHMMNENRCTFYFLVARYSCYLYFSIMKHKNEQRYSFSLKIQGSNIKNVYFDRKRMQQKQVEECILTSRMVQFCARILSVGRMCVLSFLKEDLSTAVVVTSIISNICIRKISTCISVSSRVFKLDKTVEVYRSKSIIIWWYFS